MYFGEIYNAIMGQKRRVNVTLSVLLECAGLWSKDSKSTVRYECEKRTVNWAKEVCISVTVPISVKTGVEIIGPHVCATSNRSSVYVCAREGVSECLHYTVVQMLSNCKIVRRPSTAEQH